MLNFLNRFGWLLKLIEVDRKYGYVDFSKKLITREATRVSLEVEFPQPYPGIDGGIF